MNYREIATALSTLTPDQVQTIVTASESIRSTESHLVTLSVKSKTRKRRGPSKEKAAPPATPSAVAPPSPAKRRGRPPAVKALSSALDRLKSVKAGGIKVRRPSNTADIEE